MTSFQSIVFKNPEAAHTAGEAPPFFTDLNLDQITEAATAGRDAYDLGSLFYQPLNEVAEIAYRHEVFRDLEDERTAGDIGTFAEGMRSMRGRLAQSDRLHYPYQKKWWFLDAVRTYCDAVVALSKGLSTVPLRSQGLSSFRDFLAGYASSAPFVRLADETGTLLEELASVRYTLLIKDSSVTVRRYASETDHAAEVHRTFEKFRQGSVKGFAVEFSESTDMNHVEAAVLDRVALLNPEVFRRLDEFRGRNADFLDSTVGRFDREIQFYLGYRDLMRSVERSGLSFCYPEIAVDDKEIYSVAGFDLALAVKFANNGSRVVCNDFHLTDRERVFVVSGPNQGGKTTFARAFGQLHYLAALGCPVPGTEARLFLFDRLFTHFEQEEQITNLRGKLHDDLVRMREILDEATPRSIVILNEIFNSTTLSDEIFLSRRILERVDELGCLGVCVTFIEELASLSDGTVSMVSTVEPENPAERTFKIVRRPADGLAYAMAIARRHGLTYASLRERLPS